MDSASETNGSGMMGSHRVLLWLLWGVAGGVGCESLGTDDGLGDEVEDLTIVVEADRSRIEEQEKTLADQRRVMETESERLERERQEVARRLSSLSKKDRKQRDRLEAENRRLEEDATKLRERRNKLDAEREELEGEKTVLLERIASMTKRGRGGLTIEQREAALARRERVLAQREAKLAQREAKLAAREAKVSQTLGNLEQFVAGLRSGGGAVRQAGTSAIAPGSAATRPQAQRLQRQVRSRMNKKGLMEADLPPTARDLGRQAASAMQAKDFATAVDSLGRLQSVVDGIQINQDFVAAKMTRLNRAVADRSLDERAQRRVAALLAELSDAFADGRYDRANKKANQIASILNGS